MKNYFFIVLFAGVWSCEDAELINSNLDETHNYTILSALRERTDISFDKKTRDLNTLLSDSSSFAYIFPNTDISCGHIIRYYFHTNIHLGEDSNELISMDQSVFRLVEFDSLQEEEYIINLSEQVIATIGDMYYGYSELQDFLDDYPDVVLPN